ncbi:MAG TPA: malonyl-ACP O-methyltransferase BioC [Casimicrobiaceae bacterium]|jgi:malonyl-CoA O-methyltransferase|nr:malonyl-ACP O-methyltransferase BioC [Casimicrobiaceae bacterium]
MAEPRPLPDPRALDPRGVRRAFGRAAASYDGAAALQHEVGRRLAERLDVVKLVPSTILDAGCGTGDALGELAARYPGARIVALDAAAPMVAAARARWSRGRSLFDRLLGPLKGNAHAQPAFVCGDATAIPLRAASVDLAWSNLMMQWVDEPARAFAEFRRVLTVGGLLTFTTFGPDTLKELARAFAAVDGYTHVSRFVDMHDLGDMLVHAGFADPVMDMEMITVTYPSPAALLAELKAIGATNQTRGRPRGLTGRGRRRALDGALAALARDGRVPASFEVVYGHAWKGEPRRTAEGLAIVKVEKRR